MASVPRLEELLDEPEIRKKLEAHCAQKTLIFPCYDKCGGFGKYDVILQPKNNFGLSAIEEIIFYKFPKVRMHPELPKYLFLLARKILLTPDDEPPSLRGNTPEAALRFLSYFPHIVQEYMLLRGDAKQEEYRQKAMERYGSFIKDQYGFPTLLFIDDIDFMHILNGIYRFQSKDRFRNTESMLSMVSLIEHDFKFFGAFLNKMGRGSVDDFLAGEEEYYAKQHGKEHLYSSRLLEHLWQTEPDRWKELYTLLRKIEVWLSEKEDQHALTCAMDGLVKMEPEHFQPYYEALANAALELHPYHSARQSLVSLNYAFTRPSLDGKKWLQDYIKLAAQYVEHHGVSGWKFFALSMEPPIHLRDGNAIRPFDPRGEGHRTAFMLDFLAQLDDAYQREEFATPLADVPYYLPHAGELEKVVRKVAGLVELVYNKEAPRRKVREKLEQKSKLSQLRAQFGLSLSCLEEIVCRESLEEWMGQRERNNMEYKEVVDTRDFPTLQIWPTTEYGRFIGIFTLAKKICDWSRGIGYGTGDAGDVIADAREVCSELAPHLQRGNFPEELQDKLSEYEAALRIEKPFNKIRFEFNRNPLENTINQLGGYCLFNNNKDVYASLLFSLHPSVHLLCLNTFMNESKVDTIGMAILFDAEDNEHRPYLAIEGVLAGPAMRRIVRKGNENWLWEKYFDAIMQYAASKKCPRLFLNTEHSGIQRPPHEFVRYAVDRLNKGGQPEERIKYDWQTNESGTKVFTLLRPASALEFETAWYTHWLRIQKPVENILSEFMSSSRFQRTPTPFLYNDTWWLHNKTQGREQPQWNAAEGYVRGVEVGVERK